jgi:hypothetical protein
VARPRARAVDFAERPSVFWQTGNGFFHYFIESLTVCKKAPHVLILYEPRSPTAMSAAELRRALGPAKRGKDSCSTSAETEFKSYPMFPPSQLHNSSSKSPYPRRQRKERMNRSVPGDLGQSNSIRWVGEHHRRMRMLKRGSKDHEPT